MQVAEVKIWGELVGAVAWNEEAGYATFWRKYADTVQVSPKLRDEIAKTHLNL